MASAQFAEVIHMSESFPSPQVEDGYTKLSNELLDALVRHSFSSRQYSVVLAVMRKTYGFNKKTDDIGLSQIEKMTGIFKTHLSKTVRELAEMRVLIRSQGQFGHKLSINKHYNQWGVTKTVTVTKAVTGGVTELVSTPVTKTVTTKDNHTKDNQPKEKNLLCKPACTTVESKSFLAFWEVWPKKKHKAAAIKAFNKINPNGDLLEIMLAAIAAAKASAEWIKEGGQFIPLPASWLNGQMWEDEIKPAIGSFTERQQEFLNVFNANIGDKCLPVSDWSQLLEDRISIAMAGTWDLEKWGDFWRHVRDKCVFKGQISLEWLLNRDNFVRVKRGDFE